MNKVIKSVICLAAAFLLADSGNACSNLIITKGASKDGSTLISYACDTWSICGSLSIAPGQYFQAGAMIPFKNRKGEVYAQVPQVARTFHRVGHVNEYGVLFTETTFDGRSELYDPEGLLDYFTLMYMGLARAKTAREAILVVDQLVQEHGYASTGETFSIGDKDEAWIMEIIGKGKGRKGAVWAAVRIPDGYVSAHANQSRIDKIDFKDKKNFMYSEDVVDFAREMGYFEGKDKDFSFCDAYDPIDFNGMRYCEARVWSAFNTMGKGMIGEHPSDYYLDMAMGKNPENRLPLYIKPAEKISVLDVAHIMRDHYEGTALDMTQDIGAGGFGTPFRCGPISWEYEGQHYTNERGISTPQTGFWVICQSRDWMPQGLTGICWFGVDDAGTSCVTPCYGVMSRVPECIRRGNGTNSLYSPTSLFWVTTRVANYAYGMWNRIAPDIHKTADHFISTAVEEIKAVDKAALELLNQKDKDGRAEAYEYVTEYSYQKAEQLFKTWVNLDMFVTAKYRDGYVMKQVDPDAVVTDQALPVLRGTTSPGYSEKWKEAVVKDAGDKLRFVKKAKKREILPY